MGICQAMGCLGCSFCDEDVPPTKYPPETEKIFKGKYAVLTAAFSKPSEVRRKKGAKG